MAVFSFFWDTILAAVTSCENTLKPKPIVTKIRHAFPRLAPIAWIYLLLWLFRCTTCLFWMVWYNCFALAEQSQICSIYRFGSIFILLSVVLLVDTSVYLMSVVQFLFLFRVYFWKELVGTETKWWCLNLFLKFYSMLYLWYPFNNKWGELFVS